MHACAVYNTHAPERRKECLIWPGNVFLWMSACGFNTTELSTMLSLHQSVNVQQSVSV